MKVLKNLYYTKEHEWVRVDGDRAYLGITDYAQKAMGDIVFVDLPENDSGFSKNDAFGAIESVKAASDAYTPVTGTVVDTNQDLTDNPALLNEDPYKNWMICIKLNDKSELDGLMNSEQYEEFCNKEA